MNELTIIGNVETPQTVEAETLESLLERFLLYAQVAPKSVETYRTAIKQFFKYLSAQGIQQPQTADILAYKEYLKADHKATTIQNYLTAIKIFFCWTEKERIYPDIARYVKGVKLSNEPKKDSLTGDQIESVLRGIDTNTLTGLRDYALIALLSIGGLRTIEVSRANIEDLRTRGNSTVLYIQGKGRTEKADFIKIPATVEHVIRTYLKARGSSSAKEPLFISTSNYNRNKGLTTHAISKIAKKRMQAVGLDSERLTAHSLRHSAATVARSEGAELAEVQTHLRHANISTTMLYDHSMDKLKNRSADIVSAAVFKTLNPFEIRFNGAK